LQKPQVIQASARPWWRSYGPSRKNNMGCHHSLIVGNRAISLKWVVYNAKKDEHGRVIENKA
jgi:hypothetical protein